jgi:hypothetical protein
MAVAIAVTNNKIIMIVSDQFSGHPLMVLKY